MRAPYDPILRPPVLDEWKFLNYSGTLPQRHKGTKIIRFSFFCVNIRGTRHSGLDPESRGNRFLYWVPAFAGKTIC